MTKLTKMANMGQKSLRINISSQITTLDELNHSKYLIFTDFYNFCQFLIFLKVLEDWLNEWLTTKIVSPKTFRWYWWLETIRDLVPLLTMATHALFLFHNILLVVIRITNPCLIHIVWLHIFNLNLEHWKLECYRSKECYVT